MNDVSALAPGRWHWNGWLNAKGRVIALFALLQAEPELFVLVLPDFPAAQLRDRLQRFVFRSKVSLRCMDEFSCASRVPGESSPAADRDFAQGDRQTGWRLDMTGAGGARELFVLPVDDPSLAPADAAAAEHWFSLDLEHGLPRLDVDQSEAWTPQMLSLDRLGAFSLKKGCYPGQEIVARTHYLGKARRGLAAIAGSNLETGMVILNARDEASGQVICISSDCSHALAVVQVDHADQLISAGGKPVTAIALSTGLQRPV